jgi:hypothetical protein
MTQNGFGYTGPLHNSQPGSPVAVGVIQRLCDMPEKEGIPDRCLPVAFAEVNLILYLLHKFNKFRKII